MNEATQSWSLKMTAPLEPGIVCNEIERMLEFCVGVLGLNLVSDADTTSEMSRRLGGTPHGYRIVRLQTPYGERIKLVQPANEPPKPNPVPEWLYERHGLAYLTFVIDGIGGVARHLRERGVHLISAEPIEVRKGVFALSGAKGTFDSKIEALNGAGVRVAELPEQIPELVKEAISL